MCFPHPSVPATPMVPPAPNPQTAAPSAPVINQATGSSTNAAAYDPSLRRGVDSLQIDLATPKTSPGAGLAIN